MYYRWIITIFITIYFVACRHSKEPLPIDEEKMVAILVDVHLAETALQEFVGLQRDTFGRMFYEKIFKIHQVSEQDFNRAMYLLKKDPAKMEDIYRKVVEKIDEDIQALQ